MKRRQSILNNMIYTTSPLAGGATHVENLQAGRGSSLRRDFVMLNLFQHLTSLACSLFINKILKQVQDDTIRNFRNELFNHSTLQLFNSCESSPHPNLLLKERERAWIFYTSLKDDCKKEREKSVTNLTPLSQCKTWRTLPC